MQAEKSPRVAKGTESWFINQKVTGDLWQYIFIRVSTKGRFRMIGKYHGKKQTYQVEIAQPKKSNRE